MGWQEEISVHEQSPCYGNQIQHQIQHYIRIKQP